MVLDIVFLSNGSVQVNQVVSGLGPTARLSVWFCSAWRFGGALFESEVGDRLQPGMSFEVMRMECGTQRRAKENQCALADAPPDANRGCAYRRDYIFGFR